MLFLKRSQGCRWRSNPGLGLANAFGVILEPITKPSALGLANAFGVILETDYKAF